MNDFGEMSNTGAVLSNTEMRELRLKRGECATCGERCFKKSLFKQTPITVHGRILKGRCLNCKPLRADEMVGPPPAEVRAASTRDVARANQSSGVWSGGTSTRINKKNIRKGDVQMFTSNYELDTIYSNGSKESGSGPNKSRLRTSNDISRRRRSNESYDTGSNINCYQSHARHAQAHRAYIQAQLQAEAQTQLRAQLQAQQNRAAQHGDHGEYENCSSENSNSSDNRIGSSNDNPKELIEENTSASSPRSIHRGPSKTLLQEDQPPDLNQSFSKRINSMLKQASVNFEKGTHQSIRSFCKRSNPKKWNGSSSSLESRSTNSSKSTSSPPIHAETTEINSSRSFNSRSFSNSNSGSLPPMIETDTQQQMMNSHSSSNISGSDIEELRALDKLAECGANLDATGSMDYILEIAMSYPENKRVQLVSMNMLSHATEYYTELSEEDNGIVNANANANSRHENDTIRQQENIKIIMDIMEYFPTEEILQLPCCSVLRNLSNSKEMQVLVARYGGINCIINAMQTFTDNIDIQKITIETLTNLGQNSENLFKILKRGGDKRIVESMVKHNDSLDIVNLGCIAIINLAADDYSLKTGIVQSNGADQIIFAMVVHSHDMLFLQRCLSALRVLSAGHEENTVQIVSNGAIDSIVSVMQLYKNDMMIQEEAACTLYELGTTSKTSFTIGESGGIDVLIRAMWLHSSKNNVKLQCCRALEVLTSFHPSNVALMLEIGGIPAVIHAMQQATESKNIQESSFDILYNLALDGGKHAKIKIVEKEGLDAISISMVLHRDDRTLQQKACRVLNALICEENLDAIQAANVPELMDVAAFNFPVECKKDACLMLDTLERMSRI
jgi:hypothetical protein